MWIRAWGVAGLLLLSSSAWGSEAGPSAEFWQYLMEFSDEEGQVMDPRELEALAQNATAASGIDNSQGEEAQDTGEMEP